MRDDTSHMCWARSQGPAKELDPLLPQKGAIKGLKAQEQCGQEHVSFYSKINQTLWGNNNTTKISGQYLENNLEGMVVGLSPRVLSMRKVVASRKVVLRVDQVQRMLSCCLWKLL